MHPPRRSGILLHPTSLPGRYGIGDLGKSARDFVDFLHNAKQSLWQVLPLGPTGYGDSPYQSFSAFAGNPLLISVELLCEKGYLLAEELLPENHFPYKTVDFPLVEAEKNALIAKAYEGFLENATERDRSAFLRFCVEQAPWLSDYALFMAYKTSLIQERKTEDDEDGFASFAAQTQDFLTENLQKDYYYGAVWCSWPDEIKHREPHALDTLRLALAKPIAIQQFAQFLFLTQWLDLKAYANQLGIQIIGDIPIFTAYDSADVWANQELFHLDAHGFPTVVAGVPPDYFSVSGQLWGNPIYRIYQHKRTGYNWWIERIRHQHHLADILRIDHFRGFESLWAIPFGAADATRGSWVHGFGAPFFHAVQAALGSLPIIAEDLGLITEAVHLLREEFAYPGMRVLQFGFGATSKSPHLPHSFSSDSVVYTGTHDNNTTCGWYETADPISQDHFRRYMNVSGESPSWDLIRLAISSSADMAIFPLQDVLSLGADRRMNTPGTLGKNWRFRFSPEELTPSYAETLAYLTLLFDRAPEEKASDKG